MNLRQLFSCVLASSAFLGLAGATSAQGLAAAGTTVKVPANQIEFVTSGIRQHGGEIFLGRAFGDVQNGKHGTFMKFTPGFRSLLHSHTFDYYAVVVKGVISNPEKGEKDSPLPVGSYWYQKGGEPHYTNCLSKEECIIFLVSDGKFDAQTLEKE
jgi:beta-alanine degradation protein BauB